MKAPLTIIIYQLVHMFPPKMCENFPNFSFDPNCLLFSGSTIDKNSLNVSTLPDTQVFHETTIIFAHINGIPVKPLLLNYSRYRDEFPSWRLNCAQILVFSRTRNIVQYYDEIVNWGNRNNVVIYATLTLGSLKAFMQSKFRNFVSTMRIPIYVIILQFAGEENTDNVVIYAALFSPTQGFQHWEEFPSAGGKLFPSPGELTSLRRMENYNHENHRLPLKLVWVQKIRWVDCENHREFVRIGTFCFSAFAPLQLVSRKLNFTFSTIRYVKYFL